MITQIGVDGLLDQRTRQGLAVVLDLLLPGTDASPSGRVARAHQEWIDVVIAADPGLTEPLRQVGDIAATHESCTVDDLERWSGDQLDSVIFALQAAYYMVPSVREALGYPGQIRRPISQATPEEQWSDSLIAPVKERGSIYVPTPAE